MPRDVQVGMLVCVEGDMHLKPSSALRRDIERDFAWHRGGSPVGYSGQDAKGTAAKATSPAPGRQIVRTSDLVTASSHPKIPMPSTPSTSTRGSFGKRQEPSSVAEAIATMVSPRRRFTLGPSRYSGHQSRSPPPRPEHVASEGSPCRKLSGTDDAVRDSASAGAFSPPVQMRRSSSDLADTADPEKGTNPTDCRLQGHLGSQAAASQKNLDAILATSTERRCIAYVERLHCLLNRCESQINEVQNRYEAFQQQRAAEGNAQDRSSPPMSEKVAATPPSSARHDKLGASTSAMSPAQKLYVAPEYWSQPHMLEPAPEPSPEPSPLPEPLLDMCSLESVQALEPELAQARAPASAQELATVPAQTQLAPASPDKKTGVDAASTTASTSAASSPSSFTELAVASAASSPSSFAQLASNETSPCSKEDEDLRIEAELAAEPDYEWLTVDAQQRRHDDLGLRPPRVARFIASSDFVSLGCFCGVSRALQCMGLKQYSYPFDWVRVSTKGVMHCLETKFEHFLTYSSTGSDGPKGAWFGASQWGGSFWHHDPGDAKTREDFERRIERLFGSGEIPASTTRVFVHAVNSSKEILETFRLWDALKRACPKSDVYLLILVDLQLTSGLIEHCHNQRVLVYRVPADVYSGDWTMKKQCEAYAAGCALAIRAWSREDCSGIQQMQSVAAIYEQCDAFDAGDPSNSLYWPRRPEQDAVQKSFPGLPDRGRKQSAAAPSFQTARSPSRAMSPQPLWQVVPGQVAPFGMNGTLSASVFQYRAHSPSPGPMPSVGMVALPLRTSQLQAWSVPAITPGDTPIARGDTPIARGDIEGRFLI